MTPIPERSKGREKTLPAAQVESSIALDFTTPIREALTMEFISNRHGFQLNTAFLAIKDVKVRQAVIDLISSLTENIDPLSTEGAS